MQSLIEDPMDLMGGERLDVPEECVLCDAHECGKCAICVMIESANEMKMMERSESRHTNRFARVRWAFQFAWRLDESHIAVPLPRTDCKVAVMAEEMDHETGVQSIVVERLLPAEPGTFCLEYPLFFVLAQIEHILSRMALAAPSERFYDHTWIDNRRRLEWAMMRPLADQEEARAALEAKIAEAVAAAAARKPGSFFVNNHRGSIELLLPITWTGGERYIFATVSAVIDDGRPSIRTILTEEVASSNIIAMLGACVLTSQCLPPPSPDSSLE